MRQAMTILVLFFLAFAAPSAGRTPAAAAGTSSYRGDVNEDGVLNVFDLLALLRVISHGPVSDRQREIANVDSSTDGRVTIFDLLAFLRVLSGKAEPEAIYWGPPNLAGVLPAQVLPGDTVELAFQNLRGPLSCRLFLRGEETAILRVEEASAWFVVPDSFPGGDLTVIAGSDTLGRSFLNLRNTRPPVIAGCRIFPADNPWNQPVEAFPVHPNSDQYIEKMNKLMNLHPDMTSAAFSGMPYTVVAGNQPLVPISFFYWYESDPGPYPIPDDTPIEGGPDAEGDRHTLVLDSTNCLLYEVFNIFPEPIGWRSGGGAIFDLNSNAQRPDTWTSADAAGLSILAGVVQYAEVAAGEVNHAIRFTMDVSQRAYVYPATHFASPPTDPFLPPMGLRVRLKADFSLAQFTGQALVIAQALKKYGMIMADNGGDWYFTGGVSRRWNDNELDKLKYIHGYNFEVVDADRMVVRGRGERFNIRPAANVTSPRPDTTFTAGDSVKIAVESYDNDGSVARVEFFRDAVKLGESTIEPYEYTWREVPAGSCVIAARATDNLGKSNTSWGVRVTVSADGL